MQKAGVYLRSGVILVHPHASTTAGVWIVTKPISVLKDIEPISLGKAIVNALNQSEVGIQHPTDWKQVNNLLPNAIGIKNVSTFYKSAKCIDIELEDGIITITPTRNLGVKEGFEELSMKSNSFKLSNDLGSLGVLAVKLLDESEII